MPEFILVICLSFLRLRLFMINVSKFKANGCKIPLVPEIFLGFMAFPAFDDYPTYSTLTGSFLLHRSHPTLAAPVAPVLLVWDTEGDVDL